MKNILSFLGTFCPPHLLEEIEGDLIQKFEKDVKLLGERKAKITVEHDSVFQTENFI